MWVPGRCLLTCSGTCMKKEHDRALLAGSGVGVSLCHQGRAMGRDLACATALWVTSPYSYSHRVSGGGTAVACRVSGVLSRERNLYALDFIHKSFQCHKTFTLLHFLTHFLLRAGTNTIGLLPVMSQIAAKGRLAHGVTDLLHVQHDCPRSARGRGRSGEGPVSCAPEPSWSQSSHVADARTSRTP